ncbi:MAG: hypothetical protein AABX54_01845 [Nanoarchaeota archaeon]
MDKRILLKARYERFQKQKFEKQRIVNVNEEISALVRKIELNYGISLDEALDSINLAIKNMSPIKSSIKNISVI